jgi:uncharacterized membrane protein YccC
LTAWRSRDITPGVAGTADTVSGLLDAAIEVDRTQLQAARGLRYALGVGGPLLAGVALGRPIEGVAVSAGAVLVGLTDSGAPYPRRTREMLVASIGAAISMLVGQLVGAHDVATVVLLGVWSLLAGLCVAAGTATYLVALIAPVTMAGATAVPAGGAVALGRAGLVLAGGLIQIALVLVMWRRHPDLPERTAVARLYRAVARWWRDAGQRDDRAPVFAAIARARDALGAPAGDGSAVVLWELVTVADRILARLAPLSTDPPDRAAVQRALIAVADRLDGHRRAALTADGESAAPAGLGSLDAELEAGLAVALQLAETARRQPFHRAGRSTPQWPARPALSAPAVRHAVRLAVTVVVAAAIERAWRLPHGYWVPLTVLWLLRPEFGATFTRGIQRYAGTAAGAVLATLAVVAVHPGPYALAVAAMVVAAGIFAFMLANYALTAACTTAWVVFVAALAGIPELRAAADRLLDTTVGAALALGAYLLWPAWERPGVPAMVADLIEHDRRFVAAVLRAWAEPPRADRTAIAHARVASREVRTATEAALARARAEPGSTPQRLSPGVTDEILRALREVCDGAVEVESTLGDGASTSTSTPDRLAAADAVDAALAGLAQAARHPGDGPVGGAIEVPADPAGLRRIAAAIGAARAALSRPPVRGWPPTVPTSTTDPRSDTSHGRR